MFIGDRHQHLAERQTLRQAADPDLLGGCLVQGNRIGALQTASCTLDQQGTQVTVAAAADLAQALPAAAGVLGRSQSQPRRQLPAVREVPAIADRGDDRIGGQRAHADQLPGTNASRVSLGMGGNGGIASGNPFANLLPMLRKLIKQLVQHRRQLLAHRVVAKRPPQRVVTARNHHTKLRYSNPGL